MGHFKNKRVLITGVSGFVGSHLLKRLLKEEALVYGIDVQEPSVGSQYSQQLKVLVNDINNHDTIKFIHEATPEYVFHLAGNLNPERSLNIIPQMFRDNVESFMNLCRALEGINYKCLINIGTSEEYGHNQVPFKEEYLPDPVSPYSVSKVTNTFLAKMFYQTFSMPIVTARIFLTYGPGQSERFFIPDIISKLVLGQSVDMTWGEQTREFVYIDDIVEALIAIALSDKLAGQIVNICSGKEYKLIQIAQLIESLVGTSGTLNIGKLPYRKNELMRFCGDNSKITTMTGWKPKVSLEDGILKTIQWYRKKQEEIR